MDNGQRTSWQLQTQHERLIVGRGVLAFELLEAVCGGQDGKVDHEITINA